MARFLVDIDAAVKYGVHYQRWGGPDFLHAFTGAKIRNESSYLVGALPATVDAKDYIAVGYDAIMDHRLINNSGMAHSYHFDANRFIAAMERRAFDQPKIRHIQGTVVSARMAEDGKVTSVTLDDGRIIDADYWISCIGQTAFNQKIFGETYVSYSDRLLTDRAVFCPLPYQDQPREFHPYTVARAMDHGWRWITPTWSRIGTGYVFSSNHITADQAREELARDIGRDDLEFFETDFYPRRIREFFGPNFAFNGMASGFLEPLDAPGLSMTMGILDRLKNIVWPDITNDTQRRLANQHCIAEFDQWCAFILHQYKVSRLDHTAFWRDQGAVDWTFYRGVMSNLFDPALADDGTVCFDRDPRFPFMEPWMIFHTTAGRGHRWPVKGSRAPEIINVDQNLDSPRHYDVIRTMHEIYSK